MRGTPRRSPTGPTLTVARPASRRCGPSWAAATASCTDEPSAREAIERERGKLDAVLETLTPERMVEPGVVGAWSAKDVLAHLDAAFRASRREILGMIESLSDVDLFTAGRFAWTRKNELGAYFVSATSSRDLWASTRIARWLRCTADSA